VHDVPSSQLIEDAESLAVWIETEDIRPERAQNERPNTEALGDPTVTGEIEPVDDVRPQLCRQATILTACRR
jgi:hypothetical protein